VIDKNLSLIVMPTLRCNADCQYCFERKNSDVLSPKLLSLFLWKLRPYLEQAEIDSLTFYWMGGEVLTLNPDWFYRARDLIKKTLSGEALTIEHRIQTNLIGYSKRWNPVLTEIFDGSVGSSLDFPNLFRKTVDGDTGSFNQIWEQRFREAKTNGIEVGVISVPNNQSFDMGALDFYLYYVERLGITSFQLNAPFPSVAKMGQRGLLLNTQRLTRFCIDLIDVWLDRGYSQGISINPFREMITYFMTGSNRLACVWKDNCANSFISMDPRGHIGLCDCWVTSHPDMRFGNIRTESMSDILMGKMRQRFLRRPSQLLEDGTCIECDYLALCHGGCPIRAYSTSGTLASKDPYCETYSALFGYAREKAVQLATRACT
jgi:uncharacterized protein